MCSSSPSCWMAVGLVSASGQFSRFHKLQRWRRVTSFFLVDLVVLVLFLGPSSWYSLFDLWTNSDVYLLFWLHV